MSASTTPRKSIHTKHGRKEPKHSFSPVYLDNKKSKMLSAYKAALQVNSTNSTPKNTDEPSMTVVDSASQKPKSSLTQEPSKNTEDTTVIIIDKKESPWYHHERPRAPFTDTKCSSNIMTPSPTERLKELVLQSPSLGHDSQQQTLLLLEPPAAYADPSPELEELENACPQSVTTLDCSLPPTFAKWTSFDHVTRPIAVKRGLPDGCEQQQTVKMIEVARSSSPILKNISNSNGENWPSPYKKCFLHDTQKPFQTSKHSAFLPVHRSHETKVV